MSKGNKIKEVVSAKDIMHNGKPILDYSKEEIVQILSAEMLKDKQAITKLSSGIGSEKLAMALEYLKVAPFQFGDNFKTVANLEAVKEAFKYVESSLGFDKRHIDYKPE